jgi:hypothetical protein
MWSGALPDWFELEEPLIELVEFARMSPTFIATESSAVVAFLTVKPQTPQAAEIIASGFCAVLPAGAR